MAALISCHRFTLGASLRDAPKIPGVNRNCCYPTASTSLLLERRDKSSWAAPARKGNRATMTRKRNLVGMLIRGCTNKSRPCIYSLLCLSSCLAAAATATAGHLGHRGRHRVDPWLRKFVTLSPGSAMCPGAFPSPALQEGALTTSVSAAHRACDGEQGCPGQTAPCCRTAAREAQQQPEHRCTHRDGS